MTTSYGEALRESRFVVVLDAMRYDVFAKLHGELELGGELKEADSGCCLTSDWYLTYWLGQARTGDVHLISSSPVPISRLGHRAAEQFKSAVWADPASKRSTELYGDAGRYDPDAALQILEAVVQEGERYLVHLMPPHLPFLGERGMTLLTRLGLDSDQQRNLYRVVEQYGRQGHWDELERYYRENAQVALEALQRHAAVLAGPTVITSDHGERLGEGGIYGHGKCPECPRQKRILRRVPLLELYAGGEL